MPIMNSVIAAQAIENKMQVFNSNTVSPCGVATDASNHSAVKVFPVVIQYFDWKAGGVQSELTEVLHRSNGAAHCCSVYQGNSVLICRISGTYYLLFLKAFSCFNRTENANKENIFHFSEIHNYISLLLCE